MQSRFIHATMTEKRRQWLERLLDEGPLHSSSTVGYYCRKIGWSEWFVTLADGREMPISELYAQFEEKHQAWALVARGTSDRECITPEGRAALAKEGK